jgi:MIP family channel proteins
MPSLLRRCTAEATGTFALVFIGAGSVMCTYFPKSDYGVLGISIAHGLVLAVMVSATMSISGGHLNPAVTLGLLSVRRVNVATAGGYIAAQLLGGVLAAVALKLLFPEGVAGITSLGTPRLAASISLGQGIALEAILGFFLISAVFGTCVNPDGPRIGGFGIGLALMFDVLVGGSLTGAAVNPARAFGPALISGNWLSQAVYWVGPIVGGVLAAVLWEYVLLPKAPVTARRRKTD